MSVWKLSIFKLSKGKEQLIKEDEDFILSGIRKFDFTPQTSLVSIEVKNSERGEIKIVIKDI